MKLLRSSFFILFWLPALLPACKDFAPDPAPEGGRNPERNFELFWHDLQYTYPFFDYDGVDWRQTYSFYRPLITPSTPDSTLFQYMAAMMTPLMDGHASLKRHDDVLNADDTWANPRKPGILDFDLEVVLVDYLGLNFAAQKGRKIIIGQPEGHAGVLYFYIPSFSNTGLAMAMDSAIRAVGAQNVRGIVVDVRNNLGGLISESEQVAGLFARTVTPFLLERYKNGPRPSDLTPPETRSFSPYRGLAFTEKPVVLLTNGSSASSSERLRLALAQLPNAFCIGDTTYGATSPIIERTLPNGFRYVLVGSVTTGLDGTLYERRGIPPDQYRTNTIPDLRAGRDRVLQAALDRIP